MPMSTISSPRRVALSSNSDQTKATLELDSITLTVDYEYGCRFQDINLIRLDGSDCYVFYRLVPHTRTFVESMRELRQELLDQEPGLMCLLKTRLSYAYRNYGYQN
jgi:hypothetical protein